MKFEEVDLIIHVKDDKILNIKSTYNFIVDNDKLYYEGYLVHKVGGPAIYSKNGYNMFFSFEKDCFGGLLSYWSGDKWYFLDGINYSEEEYYKIMNILKKKETLENILWKTGN